VGVSLQWRQEGMQGGLPLGWPPAGPRVGGCRSPGGRTLLVPHSCCCCHCSMPLCPAQGHQSAHQCLQMGQEYTRQREAGRGRERCRVRVAAGAGSAVAHLQGLVAALMRQWGDFVTISKPLPHGPPPQL